MPMTDDKGIQIISDILGYCGLWITCTTVGIKIVFVAAPGSQVQRGKAFHVYSNQMVNEVEDRCLQLQ